MTYHKYASHYLLLTCLAAILLITNFVSALILDIFSSPFLFIVAVLAELLLLGLFGYGLIRMLTSSSWFLTYIFSPLQKTLLVRTAVGKLRQSRNPTLVWFKNRFDKQNRWGLILTVTVIIAAFFAIHFYGVLVHVVSSGLLTQVDLRSAHLIPTIRTPDQTIVFRIATMLAGPESSLLLTITMVSILWRKHQRLLSAIVIGTAAVTEILTYTIKLLVQRARPDSALAIVHASSYSFPSGHTVWATVMFGLLAYLLSTSYRTIKARLMLASGYIVAVLLVALSRTYLGAHYLTDVWAGVLLGLTILSVVIGGLEILQRRGGDMHVTTKNIGRALLAVPIILLLFAVATASYFVKLKPSTFSHSQVVLSAVDSTTLHLLPIHPQNLTGKPSEPIDFVYIGSASQIKQLFLSHGWYKADPSTVNNTLKAVAVGFQGQQYNTAPVTPAYIDYMPEDLAFEHASAKNSLRQRHHTRLWQTGFKLADGRPVWVAAASFDIGVELAGKAKLPTHRIAANLDEERAYIITSLELQNNLVKLSAPTSNKNASGDTYYTDGYAELVTIP